jgi:isopenicillin N synthase-like dioxygenase
MTDKQLFNNHTLIDFDKLSDGDSSEINRLQNEFEINGWCFIRLPDQKGEQSDKLNEVQRTLTAFFSQDQMEKLQYKSSNAFGYSRVGHKEGIKVLIDQHSLVSYHHPLTNDVEQTLKYLAILLDNFTNILKSIILKMPILSESPTKKKVPLSPLSMLDIVHYFNERTGPAQQPQVGLNTDEVNCVPHFDPGLFSLSILSTCDGLQLNDRLQNKWIDGPNNSEDSQRFIGVIWLGEAASILTQNRFKSGIHRVVYPRIPHRSRLTIWQEVCTVDQIEPLLQRDDKPIVMPENTAIQMVNQPNSMPLRVRPGGETLNDFMNRVEDERGLSVSKSGRRHVKKFDSYNKNQLVPQQQQQTNQNFLPAGASVTMTNQPDSVPLEIQSGGETLNNFMKRVEDKRGLSMSKSGVEHLQIRYPVRKNQESNPPKKKRSFFSKLFNG